MIMCKNILPVCSLLKIGAPAILLPGSRLGGVPGGVTPPRVPPGVLLGRKVPLLCRTTIGMSLRSLEEKGSLPQVPPWSRSRPQGPAPMEGRL